LSTEQVARVYARALFEAATEANAVEAVRADLDGFAVAVESSPALQKVLSDPQIDTAAKQRVVAEIARAGQPLVANTLQLLLERGRMAILPELNAAYGGLAAEAAALVKVDVTSAVELNAEASNRIVARVEAVTGRRVELTQRVDPEIIGGLVLRVGDVIVDSSLKARIRQLRRRLATAELRGEVE
jgi:F-type H+-transporting ATPase subunit delta